MRRIRLLAALTSLALLWIGPSLAGLSAEAPSGAKAEPRGFLWDARKGGHHALLMGTLHVGEASDYPPDASIRRRVAAVDVIALEADVSQAARSEAALRDRAMFADSEAGLDTRIEARLKADTLRAMGQVGLPADRAWRMKPWMLGDSLVVLQAVKLGFSPAYSTEAYLLSLAASDGKPIAELEGVEAQFELLDSQPWSEQVDALRQVVDSILNGDAEHELRAVVAAWRGSSVSEMQDYLKRVRASSDPVERRQFERLITARNATMAATIDRLLEDGRFYLIAVGSLHFFGADGLVQALRARGYTVTPIVPQEAHAAHGAHAAHAAHAAIAR